MIRAVVFDFDGVLADSEPLHLRSTQEALAPLGVAVDPAVYYQRYLGFNDEDAFRAIAADLGLGLDGQALARLIAAKSDAYQALLGGHGVLYAGAAACVERLAAEFPLGIASGAMRHEIEAILRAGGLDRHFRFIVASGETPNSKPSPDPYARAAVLHGLPPEACVAIEDSRWGIESARAAGLRCVGITHTYPAAELPGADVVVDRLEQFTPELIRGLR